MDEVRRIMGPRQSITYSPTSNGFSTNEIPRRPKRKGKYQLAVARHGTDTKKHRSSAASFQKKLFVFKYMGINAPEKFTRVDKDIVTRGLLPQISVSAKESDVRYEICQVLNSCEVPDLSEIGPGDFHFINMSGKQASVPRCKQGFEWNGRAVKELAGSGAVYIRLAKSPYSSSSSSSSDDELIPYLESASSLSTTTTFDECSRQQVPPSAVPPRASRAVVAPTVVAPSSLISTVRSSYTTTSNEYPSQQVTPTPSASRTPVTPVVSPRSPISIVPSTASSSTTISNESSRQQVMPSTFPSRTPRAPVIPVRFATMPTTSSSSVLMNNAATDALNNTASCSTTLDPVIVLDDDNNDSTSCSSRDDIIEVHSKSDVTKLAEMFPDFTSEQLRYIYSLSGSSLSKVIECLIEGPSIESILSIAALQRSTSDSARIRLQRDDTVEDWTEAALAFYKQGKFEKSAGMRVCIYGQPAIDAGGVRRQFFANIFARLAQTDLDDCLFEGSPVRLRPAFKASVLSSGILSTLGTMVAHSLLLDGQGFPYLSDYCYYYIAGCYNQAVTCVTVDDAGIKVKSITETVNHEPQ